MGAEAHLINLIPTLKNIMAGRFTAFVSTLLEGRGLLGKAPPAYYRKFKIQPLK